MTDSEEELIKEIHSDPQGVEARLVYADWLEDAGDNRAEYLRKEVEFSELDANNENYFTCLDELISSAQGLDETWMDVVGIRFDIQILSVGSQKLEAVKIVKWLSGLSLMGAKKLTESAPSTVGEGKSFIHFHKLLDGWGKYHLKTASSKGPQYGFKKSLHGPEIVKASQILSGGGEPTTLRLENFGQSKLETVKFIKSLTGLSLMESKRLVESCPCVVIENVTLDQRNQIESELKRMGNRTGDPVFKFV